MYYITDSAGCQSETYTASVSCSVVTYVYEVREHLNNCSQLSVATYAVESSLQYSVGDTVALDNRNGCYAIMGTTQDQPQYTIVQDFPDCASCSPVTPNSYEVQSCDTQAVVFISRSPFTLSPGNIVSLQNTPGCWEVVGDDVATPTDTATQIHKSCALCANQGNFIYYAFFCDGSTSPRYFTSTIQLTQGTIVKVLDGTFAGKCVSIISQNQSGFSEGNIDTSLAYDDCASCQGITVDTCHRIVTGSTAVNISYEQGGSTYTGSLIANRIYNFCGQNFQEVSGSWDSITDRGTTCSNDFDCRELIYRTSCHTLSGGGITGSQFDYQDSSGTFQTIYVNPFTIVTICAVINSVTRTSGNGSYNDNQSLCLTDDDCSTIGPGDPIP